MGFLPRFIFSRLIVSWVLYWLLTFSSALAQTAVPERQQSVVNSAPEIAQARQLPQAGRAEEALAVLRSLEQKGSNVTGLAHELGVAYYKKGDPVAAIPYFKRAIEQNQQDL